MDWSCHIFSAHIFLTMHIDQFIVNSLTTGQSQLEFVI